MELFTLASAAKLLSCHPARIRKWMDRGYIPEKRIQLGSVQARILDAETIERLLPVVKGIDVEGLPVKRAFAKYF
jgi:hypothetical protein